MKRFLIPLGILVLALLSAVLACANEAASAPAIQYWSNT